MTVHQMRRKVPDVNFSRLIYSLVFVAIDKGNKILAYAETGCVFQGKILRAWIFLSCERLRRENVQLSRAITHCINRADVSDCVH